MPRRVATVFQKQKLPSWPSLIAKAPSNSRRGFKRLHARYEKRIDIDGVADVSMIPEPFHGGLREAFRKEVTYSVMLDWDGSVAKQFGYTKGVANIYVINRRGHGAMREAAARAFRPDRPRARKPFAKMTAFSPLGLITGCRTTCALATRALSHGYRERHAGRSNSTIWSPRIPDVPFSRARRHKLGAAWRNWRL